MTGKRLLGVLAAALLLLTVAACERQKIGDIVADPGRYAEKEVNVGGRVTQAFGFMGRGLYQIDDGTGSLWVLSENRGVPSKDALVGVRGRITPTLTFMGRNYATVVRESNRRAGD
jgi:hypothetical protein